MTTPREISSTRLFLAAAHQTVRLYGPTWRAGWARLIPLYGLQVAANQFFLFATDYLRQIGREDIGFIAMIAGLELVFSLFWSAAWILCVAEASKARTEPMNFKFSFIKHFSFLVIEQVRSLAAILWRVPLLIVPAVVEYVRLVFVPLVVILDPDYDAGKVDALASSRAFTKWHFWLLSLTLIVSLALPYLIEEIAQGDLGASLANNPIGVPTAWVLTLLVNLGTSLFLIALYRARYEGSIDHDFREQSVGVQLARH